MIVKDEIKTLEKCIESVKSIVDEYIIIDTGSTDGTQEIIKKYGTLHEMPFTNYADCKNAAIKFATSDFILFMDSDETVVEGLQFLKEWANTKGTNCVNALIVEGDGNSISNEYIRARLWLNDNNWHFVGPGGIHETLLPTGNSKTMTDYRIKILHSHANRSPESYAIRFNGYIKILNEYLKDNPNDARGVFYLARTHKDLGNYLDAIENYRKYMTLNTTFKDERWNARYDEALCFLELGEFEQCFKACDLAEEIDPRRAEISVLRGQIYFNQQELDRAIEQFEKAVSMPIPQDVLLFLNPRSHSEIPRDFLVMLYDKKRNYREAFKHCKVLADKYSKPDSRQTHNLTWLNKVQYKNIFFTMGRTPEFVTGDLLEKQGAGGLESVFLELSKQMALRQHNVFVFCHTQEEHIYNNCYFIPYEKIDEYKGLNPEVIITSRDYNSLYQFPNAKKIVWAQDNFYVDQNHGDAWQIANAIVSSSAWHKNYLTQRLGLSIDSKKINVIPLSIRGELYQNKNIERKQKKLIFSSNPNRGLSTLKSYWDELCEKVPDISLSVVYGFTGLKTWSNDPAWKESVDKEEASIIEWAKSSGNVELKGRLTKPQLAEEQLSSSICSYPTQFFETFGLTYLEMQAAGVVTVTTQLAALDTTLSHESNVLIDKNPTSDEYKKEFINSIVALLFHQDKLKQYSQGCKDFFANQPDWSQVATMWESMIYKL